MKDSGHRLGPEEGDLPNPGAEVLSACAGSSGEPAQQRFACPICGQHYSVDNSQAGPEMVCVSCGQSFLPRPLPPSTGPATRAPTRVNVVARVVSRPAFKPQSPPNQLLPLTQNREWKSGSADVLALFTPLLMSGAMSFGLATYFLALLISPLIGYWVSVRLCRQVLRSGGIIALRRYLRSSVMSFVLWGLLISGAVFLAERWLLEGAGLLLVPLWGLAGVALVLVFIIWAWSASTVWYSATGDEGPSWPG